MDSMSDPLPIGLVFHYSLSYPRGVLRGIRQFVQTRPHWVLMHFDTDRLRERELKIMQPAGMIALVVNDHLAHVLESVRGPVVNIATVLADLPFPRVSTDHGQVAILAAAHLRERGFRHFGFVGHSQHVYSLEREAAFQRGLAQHGHSLAIYHEQPVPTYPNRGRHLVMNRGFRRWLRQLPKPVGLFACNDLWGLPILEACRLEGLSVPDEVAVVSVDNDELRCELARPSLSSIAVSSERVGYEAAALLDRLLAGAKRPRAPLLIPPVRVVARQSSDIVAGNDAEVNAAVRFIRNHAHQPISVTDVLREVPVARRSLERRFRALLERGIGEEIQHAHLERARDLLATTSLPMDVVAERAGFSTPNYMCRVFQRAMALTPTAYRRRTQNPS
jgi:LacI family transcriptional regulator